MYTKYSVSIELSKNSIYQSPSKEKKAQEKVFFPFKTIWVTVEEKYICPICGKGIHSYRLVCFCKDFQAKFKKLQESYQDFKHESKLHDDVFHPYVYKQSIESLDVKLLDDEEIKGLGPDVWDEATRVVDSGYLYLIANALYQGNKCTFLCKDIQTKKVYQCTTEEFDVSTNKIYLGIRRKKTVSHGLAPNGEIRCGNYHFEDYWDNVASFESWDQLCRVIQAM
jgi:hypothetical protein